MTTRLKNWIYGPRADETHELGRIENGRVTAATDGTEDDATDNNLLRESVTWSKGRIRRAKLMSMIAGNRQPSRKEIFCGQTSEDRRIWNVSVQGKTIHCAKIFNPSILLRQNDPLQDDLFSELANINRLEIEDPEGMLKTVPKQLVGRLTKLESLSMTWTKISSLPPEFFQLPLLKSLYLQRNQIKSLDGIERAEPLTILDVSNNKIRSLPKTFGQLVNLITVNLSGNELKELPDSIGSLVRMRTLDASCNKLRSIPDSIGNAIELTSLDFGKNQLTSLPESLANLPNLEDLRVRSNQLRCLPENFGQLHRLSSLLLRSNRFTEVPEQLSELGNLTNLNMRENQITRMARSIVSLRYLVLDQNELTCLDVGIVGSVNLQLLSLQQNKIKELSDEGIGRLRALRSLHLADNDIASLPVSVGRLEHLRHLNVRSTKISELPLAIAKMPNLTTLEMEGCDDLDEYLKIAYRENGMPGVLRYLTEQQLQPGDNDGPEIIRPPAPSAATSKPLVDMTNRETLMYADPVVHRSNGTSGKLRNQAGMSIVPGVTVTPPPGEAVVSGGGLVHIARQSICPTGFGPNDPPTVAGKPTAGGGGIVNVAISADDDQDVIENLEQFGDLKTSSTTDQGQSTLPGVREEEEEEDIDDEMTELYAKLTKKS